MSVIFAFSDIFSDLRRQYDRIDLILFRHLIFKKFGQRPANDQRKSGVDLPPAFHFYLLGSENLRCPNINVKTKLCNRATL